MQEQLINFIEVLKKDGKIKFFDEAATRQAVIIRLLPLLGWDTFNIDEVTPEYSVSGKKVDYSLRISNSNKAFIEVKKISEELKNHQKQLLDYSFQEGIKISILTNGTTWWFYLPLHEGSWEQRKFYTIDILQQKSEDIASKFIDLLSKDNISTGKAVQNAEVILQGGIKVTKLKEALPKAWNEIIEEAEGLFIDMLNERTEKLCGYRAEPELIEQFLSEHKGHIKIPIAKEEPSPGKGGNDQPPPPGPPYTGRSITSFSFRGSQYEIRSWRELLVKLCNILNTTHRTEFEKVLSLKGTKNVYFTHNKNELSNPEKINNTNIFVETKWSANGIVKFCYDILGLFGYSSSDLKIEARDRTET
jgi:hypothetical protein